MNQPQQLGASSASWYVFVGEGICLKVPTELSVGEDASGLVVLNPQESTANLLRVHVDDKGRLLVEAVGQAHVLEWEVGSGSVIDGLISVPPGTRVVLPHNELYFGHEMQRGAESARLVLEEMIALIPEPILVPEPPVLAASARVEVPPLVVKEARPISTANVRARRGIRRRTGMSNPTNWLFALAAMLLVAGPYVYFEVYLDARSEPPTQQAVQAPAAEVQPMADAPEPIADVSVPIADVPVPIADAPISAVPPAAVPVVEPESTAAIPTNVEVEVASDVLQAIEVIETIESAQPAPEIPAQALVPVRARPDAQTAQRLERARNYLDRGAIITPADNNAVRQLSLVLHADPENPEALSMMGEAADKMVDAAVEAYEQGASFEARNLIEEVRVFHPQHAAANEYWRRWTGD